jgi:hypothetical protein
MSSVTGIVASVPAPTAAPAVTQKAEVEPAFVEIEGEGVRLYQVSTAQSAATNVQVAFIVDPRLVL